MSQKLVSFEVAKCLKVAGYPQNMIGGYYSEICKSEVRCKLFPDVQVVDTMYAAPTYFEVWKWLWTYKNIKICVEQCGMFYINGIHKSNMPNNNYNSPQESIIAAIEYLVDNKLLK